ncbi:MAG: glycosyltransferase [Frankia sp.]
MRVLYITARFPKLSESFIQAEVRQIVRLDETVGVASWRREASPEPSGASSSDDSEGGFDPVRPGWPSIGNIVVCLRSAFAIGCSTSRREFATGVFRSASLVRGTKAWNPEIIHAHFVSLPTYVALILGHVLRVPVTVMPHARDYKVAVSPRALRNRLGRCAWIFPISGQALAEILHLCGFPNGLESRSNVVRASWAVTGARDHGGPPLGDEGPPSGDNAPFTIVTVARLVPKKGVDIAVRAIAELSRLGHPVRYRVVGDGPERPRLERLAVDLGVADRIDFLGALSHDLVEKIMARSDAALLLSRQAADGDTDGVPVSLMEAAALGLPVVSTNVGGIAELVEDGRSGRLCSPDDPIGASRLILELMNDPRLAAALGENLRRRVLDEFNPRRQAERLQERWGNLISV